MKPASSDRRPIHHSPIFWIGIARCLATKNMVVIFWRGDTAIWATMWVTWLNLPLSIRMDFRVPTP